MGIFTAIRSDLRAALERDPAARGTLDVILSYPGFHALVGYRVVHALQATRIPLLPRFLAHITRFLTGIEIHPAARIGNGMFIDHGMGVVIGETAEVGDNCTLYQGVTLGGTSLAQGKRHPTLGRDIVVGVGAAILGAIRVGDGARIGGGSVVVRDVPQNATVVGVPARIVMQDGKPVRTVADVLRVEMPDPNADAIGRLQHKIEELERRLDELEPEADGTAWSWVI